MPDEELVFGTDTVAGQVGVLNASGYPARDKYLIDKGTGKGRWISIRGKAKWNVYIDGDGDLVAKVNASMSGQKEHEDGFVAALTKATMTTNIQVDKPVPFVQIEVTAGVLTEAYVYASD